jgi:non-ribosomal peptide synthase protein (TIGR01720 family)
VGWFTSLYPVRLEVAGGVELGAALKGVKEQLRQVPQRGIGYGLLRYLGGDPELTAALAGQPGAEVSFNYLGQVDQVLAETGAFGAAPEGSGPARSPLGVRRHLLEVNGIVAGGQLQVSWTYSQAVHHPETVAGLATGYLAALRALIAHCQSPQARGFTPSDFPAARLKQQDLDRLMNRIGQSGAKRGK